MPRHQHPSRSIARGWVHDVGARSSLRRLSTIIYARTYGRQQTLAVSAWALLVAEPVVNPLEGSVTPEGPRQAGPYFGPLPSPICQTA